MTLGSTYHFIYFYQRRIHFGTSASLRKLCGKKDYSCSFRRLAYAPNLMHELIRLNTFLKIFYLLNLKINRFQPGIIAFFYLRIMNTGFKDFFRGLFEVTTNELKGYYVLFLVVLFSLLVPVIVKMTLEKNAVPEEKDLAVLDSLVRILDEHTVNTGQAYMIDPNKMSLDSLTGAGIREDIALRIVHYRQRGGQFRYREDLKRIYGLDEMMYKDLEARLALPDSMTYTEHLRKRRVDINRANVSDLMRLAGLDGKIAGRVIKYGRSLGGYVSEEQFDEIYGVPVEKLRLLKRFFYVSKNFVPVKIKVNRAGWRDLAKHPYIPEKLAGSIIRYREINGPIADMNELSAFSMVDEQREKRLSPYLEF